MASPIGLREVHPDGEADQSDHIDVLLRDAFKPTGPQRMVRMLKRYDRYMVGEIVQFPAKQAADLVERKGAAYVTTDALAALADATAPVAEPLVGVRFLGRYGLYFRDDEAAFPAAQARELCALTFKDPQGETHPLALPCPLPPAETAPSPIPTQARARGHGGKDPSLEADSNGAGA